jgi:hypothetical protein
MMPSGGGLLHTALAWNDTRGQRVSDPLLSTQAGSQGGRAPSTRTCAAVPVAGGFGQCDGGSVRHGEACGFTCREVVPTGRQRIHVLFCVNCWCDVLASSVPRPLGDSRASAPHMPHTIPLFHFITFHYSYLLWRCRPTTSWARRSGLSTRQSREPHTARRRRDPVCVVFVCPPTRNGPHASRGEVVARVQTRG